MSRIEVEPTATSAAYPEVAVPFNIPEACYMSMTGDVLPYATQTTIPVNGTFITTTATISAAILHSGVPGFSTCQPKGWETMMRAGSPYSSPGVCPGNWEATRSDVALQSTKYVTGAWCCRQQDKYHPDTEIGSEYVATPALLPHACRRSITMDAVTATITEGALKGQTTQFRSGVFFYPAIRIEWEASDIPSPTRNLNSNRNTLQTLEPTPAASTPIWVQPTYTSSSGPYISSDESGRRHSNMVVGIAIPLFIAIAVAGSVYYTMTKKRRRLANEARMREAGIPLDDRGAPSVYPVPAARPPTPPPAPAYEPPAPGSNVVVEPPPPEYLHPSEPPAYKEVRGRVEEV